MIMKTVTLIFVVLATTHSAKLPSNFKKCQRKDLNAQKCYLEAAQTIIPQLTKAYPDINLPIIDPLEITEMNIGAGSQGVVNVNQEFSKCKLYGLSKVRVNDFSFNFTEKYVYANLVNPEADFVCTYRLNGQILLLPIVGTGPSNIKLKNVGITARLSFDEVLRNKKHYIKFGESSLTLDPEMVIFDFQNLFNGDKALGDNINKVLNENHKEVFADVKTGYEQGLCLILIQVLNNFFAKVSVEDAFD